MPPTTASSRGVTVVVCDDAGRRLGARHGRRTGHARDRPPRARSRRSQAIDAIVLVRRLGLRPRCGRQRDGAPRRRGTRLRRRRCPRAAGPGGDPLRSRQRRRQGLGRDAALCARSAPRPSQRRPATSRSAPSGPAPARPPSTSRAASARRRCASMTATTVAALVAVNALGQATHRRRPAFLGGAVRDRRRVRRAAAGRPARAAGVARSATRAQALPIENTTIGIVATDATLTKAEAKRLADHDP